MDGQVGAVAIRWGSRTHPGNRRSSNEDAILAAPGIFIVADGMGGHDGGATASAIAADVFATAVAAAGTGTLTLDETSRLVAEANRAIRDEAGRSGRAGMGTTLVGLVIALNGDQPTPVVVNVGDSRCYALADDVLRRITHDHSHIQELIDDGSLSEDDARRHPLRNVITRALGTRDVVEPDYVVLDDTHVRILLCSDGVCGELGDDAIAARLAVGSPQDAADGLVEAVLAGPAADNVSAVVVDVTMTAGVHTVGADGRPVPRDADDTAPRTPVGTP